MQAIISERAKEFRQILRATAKGRHGSKNMTREQAAQAMDFLISDEADPVQVAAFLTAMRFKGTEVDEFLGFIDAIDQYSLSVSQPVAGLLNVNGPYDGRANHINLALASSLLAVAAGVPVIMHSSTDLTPKRGVTTAHVLEALGLPAFLEFDQVTRQLQEKKFGFLHSSKFSFAIERFRRTRETLLYRSFLHGCEVLNNPATAERSLLGAAHEKFLHKFAEVAAGRGVKYVLAVQGLDGSEELPLAKTAAVEINQGQKKAFVIDPAEYGLKEKEAGPCLSPAETARVIRQTFAGQEQEYRDQILLNAGVKIYAGGKTESIAAGVKLAAVLLEQGKGQALLDSLRPE